MNSGRSAPPARAGHFADAGPLLADLLGREPRTVADRLAAGLTA
ncbi:hypothetical protein ACFYVW_19790 [Streptomyces tendae]